MQSETRPPGKTTISPDVLLTIARLTALSSAGVSRLSQVPADMNQLLKRGYAAAEGVRMLIENDTVYTDIYVVMRAEANTRDIARQIQSQVARAISEMVGMEVGKVNIHIEDIDYAPQTENAL